MRRVAPTLVFIFLFGIQAFSASGATTASRADIKAKVEKYSTDDARVRVRLKDHKKIEGRIVEINENSFSVNNRRTHTSETIAYDDVLSIRKVGMATVTKIAIGVGIGAAICVMAATIQIVRGVAG